MNLDFAKIKQAFTSRIFRNEDDVKIHFHADIVKPILESLNPSRINLYQSENTLLAGGKTDATFQNILFELKRLNRFATSSGINEALFGRNDSDHGLYDYILSNSGVQQEDSEEEICRKILAGVGVGFDGNSFLFCRFVPCHELQKMKAQKHTLPIPNQLPLRFDFEKKTFEVGLKKLALLLKQQDHIALTKKNLLSKINTKNTFVRESILEIYKKLYQIVHGENSNSRVKTLFNEWDRVFGVLYGEDADATDFTEVSSSIREAYGISLSVTIDSKLYLFALQTFFNIFLKLLIYSFLAQVVDPAFTPKSNLTKADIDRLFDGTGGGAQGLVGNFFEAHFLEWFTYTADHFEEQIVNTMLETIDEFDLNSFVLKPENVQDILQEVYMELIPAEMRHLMGEYFSPDWIVEHALDMVGFNGDISKKMMDPACGSGPFLTQAIKRIVAKHGGSLSKSDIELITSNVVGFDVNPISVVAAKANYILTLFSAYSEDSTALGVPINIPVFIADSILAPVVYTEENGDRLNIKTCVGNLLLPKFQNIGKGNLFLSALSHAIHEKADKQSFMNYVKSKKLIELSDETIVETLFDRLYVLHRSGNDSFWPIILKNSYAPIMIGGKFDYVVGNPPWIAWKSMSKSYRDGTLKIWKSYGIFEKNAYDKKTTHDDFGMAVTYVAIDQYLKDGGDMVFLLPTSFLKSTKGGEGFRKLKIVRNGQNVAVAIKEVHDFSEVKLFTVPTSAIHFKKGEKMNYPMKNYVTWIQKGGRSIIDSHASWADVSVRLDSKCLTARPVDSNNLQSAWLTLPDMTFADKVLNPAYKRVYQGRKGIEPAGAKGVYLLLPTTKAKSGYLAIENDISRQRRTDIIKKGPHKGVIEETFVYPMLGGRNIARWHVKSNTFILLPHTKKYKYGIPTQILAKKAPDTYAWLLFYRDELLATRIQNGKFFNEKLHPFYRLDNVGEYSYLPYKVLWKEQAGSMAAVVVSSYWESIPGADKTLFSQDKPVMIDSKVLMLGTNDENEAYYVCGVINAKDVVSVIDGYAIGTNRGVDVLKYVAIPKFDRNNNLHTKIATISKAIHKDAANSRDYSALEKRLNLCVRKLFP